MGDNTVTLWDLADPTRPRQLGEPISAARHGVFFTARSTDGRTLATGSQDRTAVLSDLSALNELRAHDAERACILADGLTRSEWQHYIAGMSYEQTCD